MIIGETKVFISTDGFASWSDIDVSGGGTLSYGSIASSQKLFVYGAVPNSSLA